MVALGARALDLYFGKWIDKKMKKLGLIIAVIIAVTAGFSVVSDHYRKDLYEVAIDFEASNSRLTHQVGEFGDASFAYFEGPKVEGQEHIVLLHGFGGSKENWLRYSKYLTEKHHVIAHDLAGHGENVRDLKQNYSVVDQVEFVRAALASMGVARFHLVGNSMGGAISSLYAATYPEQVMSATLISPAGVHDIPSKMDEILEQGGNPLIAKSVDDFFDLLDFVMEDKPYIPAAIVKVEAERALSRVDINTKIFADLRADLESGMEEKLSQIQAPVLFIWGDHDRAINFENIDKYASLIPNSQKLVLENIGHLAMIEVPEVSAQATLRFLSVN